MRNIRDLESTTQGVWAATTGGILFWNRNEESFRQFTNTEGLSQNEATAIEFDNNGNLWIGQSSGVIDIFDVEHGTFDVNTDYKSHDIHDFFPVGDSMYVALDVGVSLYLTDREAVKDTYKNLGPLLEVNTAARSIFVDGQELWVATGQGVAKTLLSLPNLQAPGSWTNYTVADGLSSNEVLGFARFQGQIVAALSNGVAMFDGTHWNDITGNIGNRSIRDLQSSTTDNGETLYVATEIGLFAATTPGVWQPVGSSISKVTALEIDPDSRVWLGTSTAGLYEYRASSNQWLHREPDGPATNNITSLAIDHDGSLWCTSGFADLGVAFMVYDGERWRNFSSRDDPAIGNDCRHVQVLQNGERWIGTWGEGITVVKGEIGNFEYSRIDHTQGILAGVAENPAFVVTPFLKQDDAGNVWVSNFVAVNSNVIAVFATTGEWQYFSLGDGIVGPKVQTIEIEKTLSADRIWVGTEEHGVSVIDYNGTLMAKGDDDLTGELSLDDNLLSLNVRSIAQDRDGFMWIGTDQGLNFWFGGRVSSRFGLISDDIRVVKVDPRNNKWIGTAAGISVLSGDDNFSSSHITVENSPLVSNIITDIVINPADGVAWIATTNGLSRFRTPFTAPKADLKFLTGYPNPFRIGGDGDRFVITNLAENSAVKIYTASGKLVKTFPRDAVPGAQVVWDGRDEEDKLVSSGVYIFMAFIEETGQSAVGKVAVVRR